MREQILLEYPVQIWSSSRALKEIVKNVDVPMVADIHFHYKRAIEAAENGASCLRINPGNIGNIYKIKK